MSEPSSCWGRTGLGSTVLFVSSADDGFMLVLFRRGVLFCSCDVFLGFSAPYHQLVLVLVLVLSHTNVLGTPNHPPLYMLCRIIHVSRLLPDAELL